MKLAAGDARTVAAVLTLGVRVLRNDGQPVPRIVVEVLAELGPVEVAELLAPARAAVYASGLRPTFDELNQGASSWPAWPTVAEVAAELGISTRQVRRALASGGRLAGRRSGERTPWRVNPATVAEWKTRRRRTA